MAIKTGDLVGDYRVIGFAGSGGMGAVYKIEHVITRRIEAMKLLRIGIGSDPEEVQRFEREIQVQARLNHPNIASLYNAVRDGHAIALIMEWVDGESLRQKLERGRLPLHVALDYAGQVLGALAYAHQHGVIHRDVTPANVIITPEGVAKLTDFGLARAVTDLRVTNAGVAVGSPWYMSPEQVRAVEEPDLRTDIYSMGAVLHEMLTGRKLFDADGSFALMCAQMEQIPQPPSAFNRAVPAALDEVVAKALAKDRTERFQSAGAFRLALETAMGGAPVAKQADVREPEPKAARWKPGWKRPEWVPAWGAVRGAARRMTARLEGVQLPRAATAAIAASVTLLAILCGAALWTRPTRVEKKRAAVAAPTALTAPAVQAVPVTVPPVEPVAVTVPPVEPVAATAPQPAVQETLPAAVKPVPKVGPAVAKRRQPRPAPSAAPMFSGAVERAPAEAAQPSPSAEAPTAAPEPVAAPEPPAVAPASVAPAPAVSAAPSEPPQPEAASQKSAEEKPKKTGHWFRRALGKIIGRGDKAAATESGTAPAKD